MIHNQSRYLFIVLMIFICLLINRIRGFVINYKVTVYSHQ
nr:MAG TPA: hypothetical protein [Crassvirales sp.]